MSTQKRILILTARNLITSTGSNNTVLNLLENLDGDKYTITLGLIDNIVSDSLSISEKDLKQDPTYVPFERISTHEKVNSTIDLSEITIKQLQDSYDFAIVSIYNYYGEDGKLLGLLDLANIPYLSPSLKSSALCFDKSMTKSILRDASLKVPAGIDLHRSTYKNTIDSEIPVTYPCMVKSNTCGASRGILLVEQPSQLEEALEKAFKFSDEAIIESFLPGQEFTVGVKGHYTEAVALPSVMIKTDNSFFDYDAKYIAGQAEEICPAPIGSELEQKLRDAATRAYQATKCESHARIDMIVSAEDGAITILEINTFPGLVSSSLFPKELEATGMSLGEFIDQTIEQKCHIN